MGESVSKISRHSVNTSKSGLISQDPDEDVELMLFFPSSPASTDIKKTKKHSKDLVLLRHDYIAIKK